MAFQELLRVRSVKYVLIEGPGRGGRAQLVRGRGDRRGHGGGPAPRLQGPAAALPGWVHAKVPSSELLVTSPEVLQKTITTWQPARYSREPASTRSSLTMIDEDSSSM